MISYYRATLVIVYVLLVTAVGLAGWSMRNAFLPHATPLNPNAVTFWIRFPAQARLSADSDNGCSINANCAVQNFTLCYECHPTKSIFVLMVTDDFGHASQSLYFGSTLKGASNKFDDGNYELHLSIVNGVPIVSAWPGRAIKGGTLSLVSVKLEYSIGLGATIEIVMCACLITAVLVEIGVLVLMALNRQRTHVWLQ